MLSRLVLPWFMAVLLTGCGKTPDSKSDSSQGEKTGASPALERPGTTADSNASEAALNAALGQLTQALRKYSFEHQRLPKTLSEMVAAGYLKEMPQAPAGKKFTINEKTVQVVLANQ